jgi:hypothetical protein
LYSPKPSLLQSNNSASEEPALKKPALNNYQKATLQAMGIVLYEMRDNAPCDNAPCDNAPCDNAPCVESNNPAVEQAKFIDQTDIFIKHILAVFNVASIAELGLTWQIQDSVAITLKDNILISPDAKALTSPLLKKQLWGTLQDLFKTQEWS